MLNSNTHPATAFAKGTMTLCDKGTHFIPLSSVSDGKVNQ